MSNISHRTRAAFTLIELLVVVVIIAMLAALLIPAVIASRETARQARCTNHQKEIGVAVMNYETSKGRFPGYVNRFGNNNTPLSWAAMILSGLGREDLWSEVRAGTDPGPIRVAQLVCPSDLEHSGEPARLSYVANCGRVDSFSTLPPDQACNGVFHHQYVSTSPPSGVQSVPVPNQVKMSASDIRDGATQTLMLSEHVTPGFWTDVGEGSEGKIGFMWGVPDASQNILLVRFTGADPFDPVANDLEPGLGNPSSNHRGGVVVTFCDGHTHFLSEDIAYTVFQHLMTPDSAKAGLAGTLSEGDY